MSNAKFELDFEQEIREIEARLDELKREATAPEDAENVKNLRRELVAKIKETYANLTPWQTVEVARHPNRPQTRDYLEMIFDEIVELHGDRSFGDDAAMWTGWAKLDEYKLLVVGHQKGRTPAQRYACLGGCALPEGYRKAIAKMNLAAKFGLPIVCFIDTPGAYPGVGSEERGVAVAIAESMFNMSTLPTPIICVVIGEGGSGGALGIGVGDRVAMLEFAYYSVISPEGGAGILWKSSAHRAKAAEALKLTAKNLLNLGVVDDVLEEPVGGAHRDQRLMAQRLKRYLRAQIRDLKKIPTDELVEKRYERFRKFEFVDWE